MNAYSLIWLTFLAIAALSLVATLSLCRAAAKPTPRVKGGQR